ncbi:energy transducer TonB [Neokomagataea tanensis]|uniref:Energy transducer TonB n=2 Tax=Acetobacteraceae TaxID=433 RepID=A0A4Y6V787_9PROT|nr:energy transducer TonB [Neokomagataea tanensis]
MSANPIMFRNWYASYQQNENKRSQRRWMLSGASVSLFTAAVLGWSFMHPSPPIPLPSAAPPQAIAIEMSPIPAATPAPPQDVPVGPQHSVAPSEEVPDTPTKIDAAPSPSLHPPVPVPVVKKIKVLKKKSVTPPQQVKPVPVEAPPADKVTAPPASENTTAQSSNAAATSSVSHFSNAPVTWQGDVLARIERFKRYPSEALASHQEGTPVLFFVMDRRGHVLSAHLKKGSGYALLDEETLAVVRRAEPFPAPPPEISGATVALTVPIEFSVDE